MVTWVWQEKRGAGGSAGWGAGVVAVGDVGRGHGVGTRDMLTWGGDRGPWGGDVGWEPGALGGQAQIQTRGQW